MFPFKSYLFLINLKFPLSVVLIAIFKQPDNLLPLIPFIMLVLEQIITLVFRIIANLLEQLFHGYKAVHSIGSSSPSLSD